MGAQNKKSKELMKIQACEEREGCVVNTPVAKLMVENESSSENNPLRLNSTLAMQNIFNKINLQTLENNKSKQKIRNLKVRKAKQVRLQGKENELYAEEIEDLNFRSHVTSQINIKKERKAGAMDIFQESKTYNVMKMQG